MQRLSPNNSLKLILFGFGLLLVQFAKAEFVFGAQQSLVYQEIFNLRLVKAQSLLSDLKKEQPTNHVNSLLDAYHDFALVFTSEEKWRYQAYKIANQKRIAALQKDKSDSPWKRFVEAEILLQQALTRAKFGDYTSAVFDFQKAYKLIEANTKAYPNFLPNFKSKGIFLILLSTVPGDFKWVLQFLGLEGSFESGTAYLNNFLANSKNTDFEPFNIEIRLLLGFFTLNIAKQPAAALQVVTASEIDVTKSLIAVYTMATLARESGQNDKALQILNNRPKTEDYTQFPFLDYLQANCLLNKLELERAELAFLRFLQQFKGNNLVKDSYMRLAWIALLQQNEVLYKLRKTAALNNGLQIVDEDKQAQHQLSHAEEPNPIILKARLLFDGGYLKQAEQMLLQVDTNPLTISKKTEYAYRLARIYHESGQSEKAIITYLHAIKLGEKLPEYYAAAAYLQLGYLYESRNDFQTASFFYQRSLGFTNHAYKNSLGQKAKAGVKRCSTKNKP